MESREISLEYIKTRIKAERTTVTHLIILHCVRLPVYTLIYQTSNRPCACQFVHPCISSSFRQLIRPSFHGPLIRSTAIPLSICPSIPLPVLPSNFQSFSPLFHPPISVSVHPHVCKIICPLKTSLNVNLEMLCLNIKCIFAQSRIWLHPRLKINGK